MSTARAALQSAGAALCADTTGCRTVTLSNHGALNAMTVQMVRDLHRHYLAQPHPHPDALYVLRGDGRRSFCAGGDLKSLAGPDHVEYGKEYYKTEYEVDAFIATMPRVQVAMWSGHVLGSGVGVSVHSRFRVACETTRCAMPETQIGVVNDVGTSWVFASLPIKGLGAYMAITGNALHGADVYHAGLATHYIPLEKFDAVEAALAQLPSGEAAAKCLESFTADVMVPSFTLKEQEPLLAKAFGNLQESTRVQDIMNVLRADDSSFAKNTLELMERISPFAMCVALENMKAQHTARCNNVIDAFRRDFAVVQSAGLLRDFKIGVTALMVTKEKHPQWTDKSVRDVDMEEVQKQFEMPASFTDFLKDSAA